MVLVITITKERASFTNGQKQYLPSPTLITKDYLKQIFSNKKKLKKVVELSGCTPSHYDEISVAQLYDVCIKMPGMAEYFPD